MAGARRGGEPVGDQALADALALEFRGDRQRRVIDPAPESFSGPLTN